MEIPSTDLPPLEKRVALIHRVIVPEEEYPKEYALLVTDNSSIFIRQEKIRGSWVLRQEMRFGTALVTDVRPKTLEDYRETRLEALTSYSENLTVPHTSVVSLEMRADPLQLRRRDFFVSMVMRMQKERFQVYNFEMKYRQDQSIESSFRFYAVPLGAYVKPIRQIQTRETILREYAIDLLETYRTVLPPEVISTEPAGL